jgi:predicted ATPase
VPSEFIEVPFTTSNQNISKNHYTINSEDIFISKKETSYGIIKNVRKINFFIGSNNSGKSRFLRGLFKFGDMFISDDEISPLTLYYSFKENPLIDNSKILFPNSYEEEIFDGISRIHSLFSNLYLIEEIENKLLKIRSDFLEKEAEIRYIQFLDETLVLLIKLKFHRENEQKEKLYIPILRNLTRNVNVPSDIFNVIVKENYEIENNVFTGLKLYDELSNLKRSPIHQRQKVKEFEKFLSKTFFEDKDVEITPNEKQPSTILFSLDNKEFPVHNIGDGIQMLIVLLFPIFTAEKNTWVYIEEPETHLHPGLQRIFIETLLNDGYLKSKNLKYFFTTHSNHFLDLSLQTDEISIFQFQKGNQETFNIKNVKPNKETLDLLGVNNSSVLMANSSIWVEGPTDRKYISKFLKLLTQKGKIQNLKEDIDFAFFEYGGNLIAHYLFDPNFDEDFADEVVRKSINAFASANKIYLLADNDNATEGGKQKRREKLQAISDEEKNFKYQNTNYREIENLLPVKIIKDFLVELVNSSEKENINEISFNREDYISIGLGQFITGLFEEKGIKDFKKFKDDSGTLKSSYKTKLCEFVINGDYNYQELIENNEQLNTIISDLYKFINQK